MPKHSDASSSYWPPGWNYARWRQTIVNGEAFDMPEEENEKLRAGFREAIGADEFGHLVTLLYNESQKKKASGSKRAALEMDRTPDWLRYWRQHHKNETWGLVIFQTALYDKPKEWESFKNEAERIATFAFERQEAFDPIPDDLDYARQKFELHWVEDESLAGANADTLRAKFQELRSTLADGFVSDIFLCASPDATSSVLSIDEDDRPTAEDRMWRDSAPFVLAVTTAPDSGLPEDHDEDNYFKPVFKTAIETLVDLWYEINNDASPLHRKTIHVRVCDELGKIEGRNHRDDLEDMWWSWTPSPQRLRRRRGY